jgi:hypothetical protein
MKHQRPYWGYYLLLVLFTTIIGLSSAIAGPSVEEYAKQARAKVGEFGKELKGEFQNALKKGGPTEAIFVCSTKASAIANKISRQTGWMVRRVSLNTRNPLDRPDEFESINLQIFESTAHEKDQQGEVAQIVEVGGKKEFRYMKVIKIAPPCLKCHGPLDKITPEIKDMLKENYPHDQATGYKVGDVRGAFSVRMPLN